MRPLWAVGVLMMTGGPAAAGDPPPDLVLAAGAKAVVRVRQVVPCDGLSRGERLLNSLPPLRPGDAFTAEVIDPPARPPVLLAGSVAAIAPPGKFGRPGKVTVQLARPVDPGNGQPVPWWFDVEDQRFTSAHRRRLLTSLFMLEGFGVGASVGAQIDRGKAEATLAGAGVGLLLGVAYASFQPGQAASLEPGDTIGVVVGSTQVRKLPPEMPLTVYPAREPEEQKKRGGKKP